MPIMAIIYQMDIADKKAGLMVFVKSYIPSRRLNDFKVPCNIQIIPFEINLRKENLKGSIPGKQILSLIFDKSVRILLRSV